MTMEAKEYLKLFQCEENRLREERFARGFTTNESVELAFINEGRAFTDGVNITVDPAMDKMYEDTGAMRKTSEALGLKKVITDPWSGLYMTARAQEVHECLHIIFSRFPVPAVTDIRSTDQVRFTVLAMIDNIIEDAFIENAGVSEFPDMEIFLRWGRVSHMFAGSPAQGTVSEVIENLNERVEAGNKQAIEYILDHSAMVLLYPMFSAPPPLREHEDYIRQTAPLFLEGSLCETPDERHIYACRIFDILEPLLPDQLPDPGLLERLLGGIETHTAAKTSFTEHKSDGRKAYITRRLFSDLDGNAIDFDENGEILTQLINIMSTQLQEIDSFSAGSAAVRCVHIKGENTGASAMHRGIIIKELHHIPNASLQKSYKTITAHFERVINSYKHRLAKLLYAEDEYTENRKYFGAGISSKSFTDVKKRYWYKKHNEKRPPDLSVLLMIDGSGSMSGARRNAAVESAVILHEVLESGHIPHSIVEHRAIYDEPLLEHNVLLDFRHSPEEKYNIMRLSSYDGTREGLSLFWAEKYINAHTTEAEKVIIMISDGYPEHSCDDSDYSPPVSVKDTANAVEKIIHRGTRVIAVALGSDCYPYLKEMYPQTVECSDLNKLTGQLMKMISDELEKR